jgi:hypothetical protein
MFAKTEQDFAGDLVRIVVVALSEQSMSETFSVKVAEALSLTDIMGLLKYEDLRLIGESLNEGVKIYVHNRSTRGIRVTRVEDTITVVLNSLSAPEDHRLAKDILAILAQHSAGMIDAEMFGEVAIEKLREICDEQWERSSVESGMRALAYLIDQGKGPMTVPGVIRNLYLGERILSQFRTSGTPLDEQYLTLMRKVQYIAETDCDASIFTASKEGEGDYKLCFWFGDFKILPPVDYVMLANHDETAEIIKVRFGDLHSLSDEIFTLLDERQLVARACSEAEWRSFRQLAAAQ